MKIRAESIHVRELVEGDLFYAAGNSVLHQLVDGTLPPEVWAVTLGLKTNQPLPVDFKDIEMVFRIKLV